MEPTLAMPRNTVCPMVQLCAGRQSQAAGDTFLGAQGCPGVTFGSVLTNYSWWY